MLAAANSVFGRWDETKGEEVKKKNVTFTMSFFFSFLSVFSFSKSLLAGIGNHANLFSSSLPEHRLHANHIVPF